MWDDYRAENIKTVVLLAGEEEIQARSKRDLRSLYQEAGMEVISLPIPDFGIPELGALVPVVEAAYRAARSGRNLAVHCYAGVGRTGLFAACLAKRVFGYSGEEAISWVRRYIPGAVETAGQKGLVLAFAAAPS